MASRSIPLTLHSPLPSGGTEPLACPICHGPLLENGGGVVCRPCTLHYHCADGVYLLGPSFAMNGAPKTFTNERMRRLLEDAYTNGWDLARERFSAEVITGRLTAPATSRLARVRAKLRGLTWEDTLQDLVDPSRAGWKFLLDLTADARVLVLGPSWGAVPISLARSCAHVLLLDGSIDRLRLVRVQAWSAGFANITLARVLDPVRLPIADGGVDLVVVPGLGEWFNAVGGGHAPSRRSGAALLRELRRVLVPGGQAFVGTDRRLGPSSLAARRAAATSYSPRLLRATAEEAGFARTELFAPVPFRHKFHQILDLDRADRMNFSADPYRTRGRATRPLVRAWDLCNRGGALEQRLYACLPGLAAVLATDQERASFANRLVADLAARGQITGGAEIARYYVRPKGAAVLVIGEPAEDGAIVRLPLDERAAAVCALHHAALVRFANDERLSPELRALFPVPLAEGRFEGQRFFAETGRPGTSGRLYYSRAVRRYDRAIAAAAEVLRGLRRATEEMVTIDAAEYDRLCGRWLGELRGMVRADGHEHLDRIAGFLERTLRGATLPLGWHHGDYDFANLLYGPDDRVSGILDFEVFDPRGLPLMDLLLLLARRDIRRHGLAFGTLFVRTIWPRKLPRLEARIFAEEVRVVGADDQLCRAVALCCWLNHLALRRDSWLVRSPAWLDANLHAVVDHLGRTL